MYLLIKEEKKSLEIVNTNLINRIEALQSDIVSIDKHIVDINFWLGGLQGLATLERWDELS